MARQMCGCSPGDVSTDTVSKTIETQITALDPQRGESITGLQTVRAARAAGYEREHKRLALKYGADNPRLAALEDKRRFNEGLRRDLDFEAARAGTEMPATDRDSYVFHGFVRDLKAQGIPRLTVALYDSNGGWIRELGYGCTDERGSFLMRFDRGKAVPPEDSKSTSGPAMINSLREEGSISRLAARIYVFDANRATLHVEKEPLHPQLGEVDFRIIILAGETAPCTPPPTKPQEPPPSQPTRSTPLETIKGIGPARARKLRAAGIKDVETLVKTDMAKLVEIAGFDAHVVKREAAAALKKTKGK